MAAFAQVQLYGFVYGGPFGHFFHKLMERLFPRRDMMTLVKKASALLLKGIGLNIELENLCRALLIQGTA
jgi:hypothetical protein